MNSVSSGEAPDQLIRAIILTFILFDLFFRVHQPFPAPRETGNSTESGVGRAWFFAPGHVADPQ
jgi:hypothetical protein